jgi:hypothetical protein
MHHGTVINPSQLRIQNSVRAQQMGIGQRNLADDGAGDDVLPASLQLAALPNI